MCEGLASLYATDPRCFCQAGFRKEAAACESDEMPRWRQGRGRNIDHAVPGLVLHVLLARGQPAARFVQRGVGDAGRAAVGQQLRGKASNPVEAVSPDGTRLFVSGDVKNYFETVAYSDATGAQLWARAYQPATYSDPTAITVSPDGARVYV